MATFGAAAVATNQNPNKSIEVLCSTLKDDGITVFSGGCDKKVKTWPLLSGGQPVIVAMHDAPIKTIRLL
ncbi:hypothetical protein KPL70_021004 [Citrus sinensis]|nr:hypothetical protein KPL70_021004 [Citrus sinensis]